MAIQLKEPPTLETEAKKARRFGFEFEYASLSVADSARRLQRLLGGKIVDQKLFLSQIEGSQLGNIKIELDAAWLQQLEISIDEAQEEPDAISKQFGQYAREVLAAASDLFSQLIPVEVVTEPLEFEDLQGLEDLASVLGASGAEGTSDSWLYAFGMHINAECAKQTVSYVHSVLKAFLILYPLLLKELKVDPSRRVLTFIDPFPKAYIKKVISNDYAPSMTQFAQDYIDSNPSRNRALDLFPFFRHWDEAAFLGMNPMSPELVKPRPAFHYRLPNFDMGQEHPSISEGWNSWVKIESLASQPERLSVLCEKYVKVLKPFTGLGKSEWLSILKDEGLAET